MAIRGVLVDVDARSTVAGWLEALSGLNDLAIGVAVRGTGSAEGIARTSSFTLPLDQLGLPEADPRILAMAAAGAHCHLRELVVVTAAGSALQASV